MDFVSLGKPKKKATETALTKRHLFGIIKMQRARAFVLIFVRRPRGHLWVKTYFAYVVNFVRCYFVHPLSVLCLTTHD